MGVAETKEAVVETVSLSGNIIIKAKQKKHPPRPAENRASFTRRDAIGSGSAALAGLLLSQAYTPPLHARDARKKVIVVGGGIGGLCCAYELMGRGHEVVLLEASRRTGGHVKTMHDPLPGGLYGDLGAENFPAPPAYQEYWRYIEKFGLKAIRWPRRENVYRRFGDEWISEDDQFGDPANLKKLGFHQNEIDYILQHGFNNLSSLFFDPYIAKFKDEYQPFGVGLDHLDRVLTADLLASDGASDAALRYCARGRRSTPKKPPGPGDVSALMRIWTAGILKLRDRPFSHLEIYRLEGGNQLMTDAFAAKLGDRVRRNCPVTAIQHDGSCVKVRFDEVGKKAELTADYLVLSISPMLLAGITITPAWPEAKAYALGNTAMGMGSRVLLQTRTPFWKGDIPSINLRTGNRQMPSVCEAAHEVPGERRLLFGTGQPVQTPEETLSAFRSFYPGKAADTIEKVIVHQWWKEEPTCFGCERKPFAFGQLAKMWPHLMEPVGRIHFAGAAYDNL
ncbi:MAG: flavin monoamine oxidase family protein, partial [Verrucomicrobiales bacterium]